MDDYNNFKSYLDNMIFRFNESYHNAMNEYLINNKDGYKKGYADGHEKIKNVLIDQLIKLIGRRNKINMNNIVYMLDKSDLKSPFKTYLNKLIPNLIEQGVSAKKNITNSNDDYNSGISEAYYEILDRMKSWAKSYSINESEIGIDKINLDQEL